MKKRIKLTFAGSACIMLVMCATATPAAESTKPKLINRAIELLEQGQPVYYMGHIRALPEHLNGASKMRRLMLITSATIWNTFLSM
jgi:hypothetical protein